MSIMMISSIAVLSAGAAAISVKSDGSCAADMMRKLSEKHSDAECARVERNQRAGFNKQRNVRRAEMYKMKNIIDAIPEDAEVFTAQPEPESDDHIFVSGFGQNKPFRLNRKGVNTIDINREDDLEEDLLAHEDSSSSDEVDPEFAAELRERFGDIENIAPNQSFRLNAQGKNTHRSKNAPRNFNEIDMYAMTGKLDLFDDVSEVEVAQPVKRTRSLMEKIATGFRLNKRQRSSEKN